MTNARERVLTRLRQARPQVCDGSPTVDEASLFADLPAAAELRACFRQRFLALGGELIEASSASDAATSLLTLFANTVPPMAGRLRIAAQSFSLLSVLRRASLELDRVLQPSCELPEDAVALAEYDVGITAVDALVARTGSLFVSSATSGGRQLSVLPPLHVVVAEESQLVPSVGDALALFASDRRSSFATLISGPSRTADIEKILVLGAHGPRRLVVVLLGHRGSGHDLQQEPA